VTDGNSACIFCQIVAGVTKCELLAEDATTLAFMDIHPANEGHCLVIPKQHCATIFETEPETFAAVGRTVVRLARAVQTALRPDALSLVQANGEAAGQTVPHLHVHVLPRYRGDALPINWPRTRVVAPDRIAQVAARIRAHLAPSPSH
jgi:histidine triad (HIT) family protein